MTELTTQAAAASKPPRRKPTRKSDGSDGPPLLPVVPLQTNTPGAPNAALKEPEPKPEDGVNPRHPAAAHLRVLDADRGVVAPAEGQTARTKFAICGFASSTRGYIIELCKDPAWEIWGLNQLYRHIPRADRWFDIHWNWDQEVVPGTDHRQWARECGIPFYTHTRQLDVPTSVRYPIDAMLGIYQADYFTSTIPYMLGIALLEIDAAVLKKMRAFIKRTPKATLLTLDVADVQRRFYAEYTIGIFGIDLVVGTEYFHEKPCAEFWIGAMAVGRGINVQIPPESALCKQLFRYGYDKEPKQYLRSDELRQHQTQVTAERDEQLKKLYMMEGVIQGDERWAQVIELRSRGATI